MTKRGITDTMVTALRAVATNPGRTPRELGVSRGTLEALRKRGLATTTSQSILWMHQTPGWRPTLEGMELLGEVDRFAEDNGLVSKAREIADAIRERGLPEGWEVIGGRFSGSRCVWIVVRAPDGNYARVAIVGWDDGTVAAPLLRYTKNKEVADFLINALRTLGVTVPY